MSTPDAEQLLSPFAKRVEALRQQPTFLLTRYDQADQLSRELFHAPSVLRKSPEGIISVQLPADFDRDRLPRRICIIGGGVAGLTAAYEFKCLAEASEQRIDIEIIEKDSHLGGRVLTEYFGSDGQNSDSANLSFVEMGPMRIPSSHEVVLRYVKHFGLTLNKFNSNSICHFSRTLRRDLDLRAPAQLSGSEFFSNLSASIESFVDGYLRGPDGAAIKGFLDGKYPNGRFILARMFLEGDKREDFSWLDPELAAVLSSNPVEREKYIATWRPSPGDVEDVIFRLAYKLAPNDLAPHANGASDSAHTFAERISDLFSSKPRTAWGQAVDHISIQQAFFSCMRARPFMRQLQSLGRADVVAQLIDILWEGLGRATGLIWLEHISFGHFLREAQALNSSELYAIRGGFSRLIWSLESELRKKSRYCGVTIRTDSRVYQVGVGVWTHAGKREDRAAYVAWRTMKNVATGVDAIGQVRTDMHEAFDCVICATPASAVSRIRFTPDLYYQKKYALSSINYLSASKTGVLFNERVWQRHEHLSNVGAIKTDLLNQQLYFPTSPDDCENNALLSAYMWSENAHRFSTLDTHERDELIVGCLEEILPGCTESILQIRHHSWDAEGNPGGGAFAYYQPGQHSRYQRAMASSHPYNEPLVFFAGEHLGLIQGWIQSSMQTAIHAVWLACRVGRKVRAQS